MKGEEPDNYIKQNLLKLAQYHKSHCSSSECTISLTAVRLAFKKMNIELSEEESKVLW